MSASWGEGSDRAEHLSALADGELAAGEAATVCDLWKRDPEARQAWHAYHLIGDVLRSDDLVSRADHDCRFLLAVRSRLAAEPVVLAPAPLQVAPRAARPRWMVPAAMAASIALVAGTFVVLQPGESAVGASRPVAVAAVPPTSPDSALPSRVADAPSADPQVALAVNGRLVRDGRLDRYLAAHNQFAGTSALGLPSAFLRAATVDVEPR